MLKPGKRLHVFFGAIIHTYIIFLLFCRYKEDGHCCGEPEYKNWSWFMKLRWDINEEVGNFLTTLYSDKS